MAGSDPVCQKTTRLATVYALSLIHIWTFDRIKCRNGVIKGIIIAACFVAFYVAGRLNPDIVAIDIDGETVNVATAANLAMVTAYVLYAKDVFSKLSKLVLSKTSGTDVYKRQVQHHDHDYLRRGRRE